ncbi:MAG: CDGSH iron-sulfur domain-containing protein [Roseiarcus sp.]
MSDSAIERVAGRQASISFDGKRCIHARRCVISQPRVFKANVQGDWIDPDAASAEELMFVALNCPSGAIQVTRHDGGAPERVPQVNTIAVRENGPLAVHAQIEIGGEAIGTRATLCRCGASANKPFCDGSHVGAGFVASGEPATKPSEPLAQRDGALKITPYANGPLGVSGAVEILSGTGRAIDRTQATALCRCGGSKNKPYCDGTHKAIGFVAPATAS